MVEAVKLLDELRKFDALRKVIRGRAEVGLSGARRDMANAGYPISGNELSRMLKSFGFRRDGWLGTGYDRTPRYAWAASS